MKWKRFFAFAIVVVTAAGGAYAWSVSKQGLEWNPPMPEQTAGQPQNTAFNDVNATTFTSPQPLPRPQAPSANAPVRGIIEGFYGTPWSSEQRVSMFEFMRNHSFNTYVYAPKDDPYQRANWSALYPTPLEDEMKSLVQSANQNGIRFVYAISPGIPQPLPGQTLTPQMESESITFTSSLDRTRLEAKINQLRTMGIHTFMLSFDDVEPFLKPQDQRIYGSDYAKAHIDLANIVWQDEHAQDPDFTLWLAPTKYYGVTDNSYWKEIRTHLAASVRVIWTGAWVLNRQVTSQQATEVTKLLGRPPLLWDNYPVNDYTYVVQKKPALLMGPLGGRSPDLLTHLSGYMANPMIQPEASKIPLATIGSWLANPTKYVPEAAWNEAVQSLDGVKEPGALIHFCHYSSVSTLSPAGEDPFQDLSARYWGARTAEAKQQADANVRQELETVQALPATLQTNISNPALLTEINPWLSKLGQEAQAGLLALDMLELPASDARKSTLRKQVEGQVAALNGQPVAIGDSIMAFIQKALAT